MAEEFCGLSKFQRNNSPTFKESYDPLVAQVWLQDIEKIFKVMSCTDAHKVLFGTRMLAEEAKYWWDDARQRIEAASTEITWEIFKIEILEKYFPANFRSKKKIELLELK